MKNLVLAALLFACAGVSHAQNIFRHAGDTQPYAFVLSQASALSTPAVNTGLPPGWSLDPASGELSSGGTILATSVGVWTFSVEVKDANGVLAPPVTYTLTITAGPSIVTPTLPNAESGTVYNVTLQVTGGSGPYQWSIVSK